MLALFPLGLGMGGLVSLVFLSGTIFGCDCEWRLVEGRAVRTGFINKADPMLNA